MTLCNHSLSLGFNWGSGASGRIQILGSSDLETGSRILAVLGRPSDSQFSYHRSTCSSGTSSNSPLSRSASLWSDTQSAQASISASVNPSRRIVRTVTPKGDSDPAYLGSPKGAGSNGSWD